MHVNKENFIIEKHGYPIAGILDIDEFEDYLDITNQKLKKHIECSHNEYTSGKTKSVRELLGSLR